jgi:hypothetical protein
MQHAACSRDECWAAGCATSQCRYFCARRDWPPFMSTMMLLKYFTPMSIIWVCFFEMAAEQGVKCACQLLVCVVRGAMAKAGCAQQQHVRSTRKARADGSSGTDH